MSYSRLPAGLVCLIAAAFLPCLGQQPNSHTAGLLTTAERSLAAGQYKDAIDQATAAAQKYQANHDGAGQGDALNLIGRAHWFLGDPDAALPALLQALAFARQTGDANEEIGRLNNVANVYFVQGRYLEALHSYESALDRVRQTTSEPWNPRRRALTLLNLAVLYEQLGQSDRALAFYNEARAVPKALPPAEQAQLLSNLGTLYRRLGDPDRALASYGEAQALFQQEKHADAEIHVLQNIGIVRALDLNDLPGALAVFSEALNRSQRIGNDPQTTLGNLFRGEAYLRMHRMLEARVEFAQAFTRADRMKANEERWTALYGLGRVQQDTGEPDQALKSFRQSITVIETLRTGLSSSTLKSQFLANKRDVYDAAVSLLLSRPKPPVEELFELIEQARARNFKDILPAAGGRLTLQRVQSGLDEHTVLLEYWVTRNRLAVLWVAHAASGVRSIQLDPATLAPVESLSSHLVDAGNQTWRDLSKTAGSLLLSGLPPLVDPSISRTILVPDGPLYLLPFEAIAIPGSNQLMVERFTTWYLPSAASLVVEPPAHAPWPRFPWQLEAEAFGDPQMPTITERLPLDESWVPLPNSAVEIHAIASLLPGRVNQYLGATDRKSTFTAGFQSRPPLLHVSTHATVDLADPSRSRILFTPGKDAASQYLFWPEIQKLDFKGVDLVTLSACDTETGKFIRGEGIQSFSRAFLGAGAASTVTTLWRVGDQPTSEFMKQFYFQLAQGKPKAEALRGAKLKFLHSSSALSHPAAWAAFVLNGEGAQPIPVFFSWTSVGLVFAAIAALIVWRVIVRVKGRSPAQLKRLSGQADPVSGSAR